MEVQKKWDKWMTQNQISLSMSRVMCNPNLVGEELPEALEHFRCRLFKRDRHLDLYFSTPPEHDSFGPDEALFILAMDAASCRLLEEYEQFKEDWLSDLGELNRMHGMDARAFWEEYTTRCSQLRRLRLFLGESVYEDMLGRLELPDGYQDAS
jgi:hypothetical protein